MTHLEKLATVLVSIAVLFNLYAFGPKPAQPTLTDADVQNGDAVYVTKHDGGYRYTRIVEAP